MSWIVPENKLDEQQRDFMTNVDIDQKNVWIKGFPGSGKSVLLAYAFKKIKSKHPDAKVVVVVFTQSLIKMFQAAFSEMEVKVDIITFYSFMDNGEHYDYILSDEVQDMPAVVLRAMNQRADHVVVAGDEHQSIYEKDPKYQEPTVTTDQIRDLLSARDFELGIIHRLSTAIINAVQKLIPNMNIFSAKKDLSKSSTQIRFCRANDKGEEIKYIYNEAKKAVNVGQTTAILAPTHKSVQEIVQNILSFEGKPAWTFSTNSYSGTDYSSLNDYFSSNGIPVQYVGNGYGSFSEDSRKIIIMTYSSSKGLDFDNVFLPGIDFNLFINRDEKLAKTLFMVAMTRSRNNLYITYSGLSPHRYVRNFSSDCNRIDIHDSLTSRNNGNVFGF